MTPQSVTHVANGASVAFTFSFPIFEPSDMEVVVNGVVQSSGFSLVGIGSASGGAVRFDSVPADTTVVTLRRTGKVQVSGSDAPGFLEAKIVAGANITVTKTTDAAGEHLAIASSFDPAAFATAAQGAKADSALQSSAIGVSIQAHDADLDWVAANLSTAGRALIDDADAAAQRATLGLGSAAVKDVGTAAGQVVQLDASGKLPAVDGSALTNLNAGALATGTVPTARLGGGTADSSSFLRGDGQWAVPAAGAGYSFVASTVPSGTVTIFSGMQPGYDYMLVLEDIYANATSGAANILIQLGAGGAYRTSGYQMHYVNGVDFSTPANGFLVVDGRGEPTGMVEIINPANAGTRTAMYGYGCSSYGDWRCAGRYLTAEANDCVRITTQGSLTMSGTVVSLYARKRS